MEIGKVPPEILEKIILRPIQQRKEKRKEIVIRPQTGEDCSACDLQGEYCVISTDPITGAEQDAGYLAVQINCNDIAASGAIPIGIMLTVLLPKDSTEKTLSAIMEGAYRAADELAIEIMGGHTEITDAVTRPVVSGTVIGKTIKRHFISTGGAEIGQGILMTKWAGLEGTAIIARDNEKTLKKRLPEALVDQAIRFSQYLSVTREGRIAAEFGATAMHDVTEGGILGAVWEVARCSQKGAEIELDKIPVREETKEICRVAGIDPYRLISSGAMLITAFDAEKLCEKLLEAGIPSAVIGKITETGLTMRSGNVKQALTEPLSDEIYQVELHD